MTYYSSESLTLVIQLYTFRGRVDLVSGGLRLSLIPGWAVFHRSQAQRLRQTRYVFGGCPAWEEMQPEKQLWAAKHGWPTRAF